MQENIQVERRKKGLYKVLFDVAFEAVIIIDLDTYDIIDANPKSLKMFEYSLDELLHLKITDLSVDPEQTEIHLANENVHCVDLTWYKKKNNIKFPVEVTGARLTYEDKNLIVFNIKDLTERFQKRKIEEDLKISEKRYKAIVEDQIELICRFTPDGLLTFVNNAYCSYFGKSYEKLIGTPFMELIDDVDKETVDNSFKKINKNIPFDHYDYKFIKDGQVKWIHWSNRAIFDEDGNIVEYQSIGFDITERKILEQEVLKSKLLYQGILENLYEGFYQTNKDGNLCFLSQSALDMLGYSDKSELIGTPIRDVFLDPNEHDEFLRRLKYAGGRLYDQELDILNKNKEVITVSFNSQAIYDKNGEFSGSQGTFRDITEFNQRMNEIIKLYHVVEGSQNALVVMELDGTITYANKATLKVARSPEWVTLEEHVIGRKIRSFISFDEPENLSNVWSVVEKTGMWFGPAYVFCACSNVERIPIDVMFSKIKNGDDKSYIVASYYDVSEYRRLENKIKEQSQMYEDLYEKMQDLVTRMNTLNQTKLKKLSGLEEAFEKSVHDLTLLAPLCEGGTNAPCRRAVK